MKAKELRKKIYKENPKLELRVKRDIGFHIGCEIELARIKSGFTQIVLAQKIDSRQPVIARIESGSVLPSLDFLQRLAIALDGYWEIKFRFLTPQDNKKVKKRQQ